MRILRRRLASSALALSLLQLGLLFAAPVSACCLSRTAQAVVPGADDAPDCCPPGAHPKGECPLHRSKTGQHATHCSLKCDMTTTPLLLGAIGVLPAPSSTAIVLASSSLPSRAFSAAILRPVIPDAPPPERV